MRNEYDDDEFFIYAIAMTMAQSCFGWEGECDMAKMWSCPEKIQSRHKKYCDHLGRESTCDGTFDII
jgi:hypothetical protein